MIVWTARVPRPIGYLMGVSGLAYLVTGWVYGTEDLMSTTSGVSQAADYTFLLASSIWLLIVA